MPRERKGFEYDGKVQVGAQLRLGAAPCDNHPGYDVAIWLDDELFDGVALYVTSKKQFDEIRKRLSGNWPTRDSFTDQLQALESDYPYPD